MHFDTIVIGSGISGLNFALRAAQDGQRVLVVTKKRIAQTGTNFAQGGIAAVLSIVDDYKKHVRDTLIAGKYHNSKSAVAYMVKHGPSAIARLINLGVPFATLHGELLLTREGGHGERRIAFVSDYTGQAIEKVLVKKTRNNPLITLYEHTFAVDVLVKNKRCWGIQVIRDGKIQNIFGDTTIIATGGIGQLYENTTNPSISTGDGVAMAERAGCNFRDLEFIQFHPTAFSWHSRPRFLISEAVRGEGALLRNSKGGRFMKRYDKRAELAPRDIVSRAIFEEEKNGPVYLDFRHKKTAYVKTRFPKIYQKLKTYGLSMSKDLIPITPAAHYICGGIKVNLKGETGVENLYAFGEAAWTGVHGANRLASNSLLEALVFSDRILQKKSHAEKSIKKPVKNLQFPTPKQKWLTKIERAVLARAKKTLQQSMWKNVGIIRSEDSLKRALITINKLQGELKPLGDCNIEIIELGNMLRVAQLITKSALKRKRTLGCHCRKD